MKVRESIIERWMRFIIPMPNGCWLWSGKVVNGGYGVLKVDGGSKVAHIVSYEYFVGPIPDGMEIDHLCHDAARLAKEATHEGGWSACIGDASTLIISNPSHIA